MKYKVISLIIFLLGVLLIGSYKADEYAPFFGKTIVIDVGHGGRDPGTISGDVYEEDINLAISKYLEDELSKKGAYVLMTRYDDYDLSRPQTDLRKRSDFDNRIKLINNSKADLYLSIHLNYLSQSQYFGGQVFYSKVHKKNEGIAKKIQTVFNSELKSNREIKKIPGDLYMYKQLEVPGVLVECGFLSNPNEKYKLQQSSYQQEIARVITMGIEKVL